MGFRSAYRARASCAPDAACARPGSRRLQRAALGLARALLALLLYFSYVHPNLDVYFGIY